MNILHLSTFDSGGAGKAAHRLHQNLLRLGFDSRMLVMTKRTEDSRVFEFIGRGHPFRLKNIVTKSLLRIRSNRDYYFQDQTETSVASIDDLLDKAGFKPDVIIAHWISNFMSLEDLRRLNKKTGVPVIWYLLDMAPLTGGCHYAWECTGYMKRCGRCPALRSGSDHDLSSKILREKLHSAQDMDITIASGTSWLTAQAKRSAMFNRNRIEQIMLGVDPDIFIPLPRETARIVLGLPVDKKIVFFGAQQSKMKRKGMSYLIEALQHLADQADFDKSKLVIASAGDISETQGFLNQTFNHRHLGFLHNDEMLAKAYQAADLFVCPSVEDSGPMMINEAIMCGTPVVSFEMGVAPDLVHTGRSGYRAVLKNSEDLAKGIRYVLDLSPDEAERMSAQCRNLGMQLCHPQIQADSFRKLIDSLLGKS